MSLLAVAGANSAVAGGYDIENSVKFEPDNSEFMHFTSSQTGSDLYRMAFSVWLKRTELGTTQTIMLFGNGGSTSTRLDITFDASDRLQVAGISTTYRLTTQVFRDTSAWYHLFFQFDTTQTTANDRIKIWVNGNLIDVADFTTVNNPAEDAVLGFNRNYKNVLGARQLIDNSISQLFAGYIAQVYSSGGTPPSVTDFGEFDTDTGIWKPIDISGISPPDSVNGFFLDFTDSSDLGNDASGNNNNFTLNNITSADQATDTPTNNFCIYNPVADFRQRDLTGFKNGGTQITHSDEGQWCGGICTMGVTRGKWYWEIQQYDTDDILFGVHTFTGDVGSNTNPHNIDNCWYYYGGGGSGSYWGNYINGTGFSNSANRGTVWSAGNIIGFALNLDDDEFTFYVNGGSAGASNTNVDISSLTALGLPLIPFIGMWRSSVNLNFGGFASNTIASGNTDENGYGNFEYAPPSGYYALCTKNLAEFG